jgi:hypothetical protein
MSDATSPATCYLYWTLATACLTPTICTCCILDATCLLTLDAACYPLFAIIVFWPTSLGLHAAWHAVHFFNAACCTSLMLRAGFWLHTLHAACCMWSTSLTLHVECGYMWRLPFDAVRIHIFNATCCAHLRHYMLDAVYMPHAHLWIVLMYYVCASLVPCKMLHIWCCLLDAGYMLEATSLTLTTCHLSLWDATSHFWQCMLDTTAYRTIHLWYHMQHTGCMWDTSCEMLHVGWDIHAARYMLGCYCMLHATCYLLMLHTRR